MTLEEAFTKFAATRSHGLPWEIGEDDLRAIFTAGWHAHYEAGRQTDMWAGTLSNDLRPAGVTGLAHRTCNAEESVRAGFGAESITAEDIYAAYPRKVGKQAAIKAIKKWGKLGLPNLLTKTKAFAACVAQWPEADKKFCPHPATWFNRGSFDDDPKEWVRGAAAAPSQFSKKYE